MRFIICAGESVAAEVRLVTFACIFHFGIGLCFLMGKVLSGYVLCEVWSSRNESLSRCRVLQAVKHSSYQNSRKLLHSRAAMCTVNSRFKISLPLFEYVAIIERYCGRREQCDFVFVLCEASTLLADFQELMVIVGCLSSLFKSELLMIPTRQSKKACITKAGLCLLCLIKSIVNELLEDHGSLVSQARELCRDSTRGIK